MGRPSIGKPIRNLIQTMARTNALWRAPRIHGELLKLGIKISERTVGRKCGWCGNRVSLPSGRRVKTAAIRATLRYGASDAQKRIFPRNPVILRCL